MNAGAKFGFVFVALVSAATTGCGAAVGTSGAMDRTEEHVGAGFRPSSPVAFDREHGTAAAERAHRADLPSRVEPRVAKR